MTVTIDRALRRSLQSPSTTPLWIATTDPTQAAAAILSGYPTINSWGRYGEGPALLTDPAELPGGLLVLLDPDGLKRAEASSVADLFATSLTDAGVAATIHLPTFVNDRFPEIERAEPAVMLRLGRPIGDTVKRPRNEVVVRSLLPALKALTNGAPAILAGGWIPVDWEYLEHEKTNYESGTSINGGALPGRAGELRVHGGVGTLRFSGTDIEEATVAEQVAESLKAAAATLPYVPSSTAVFGEGRTIENHYRRVFSGGDWSRALDRFLVSSGWSTTMHQTHFDFVKAQLRDDRRVSIRRLADERIEVTIGDFRDWSVATNDEESIRAQARKYLGPVLANEEIYAAYLDSKSS